MCNICCHLVVRLQNATFCALFTPQRYGVQNEPFIFPQQKILRDDVRWPVNGVNQVTVKIIETFFGRF